MNTSEPIITMLFNFLLEKSGITLYKLKQKFQK